MMRFVMRLCGVAVLLCAALVVAGRKQIAQESSPLLELADALDRHASRIERFRAEYTITEGTVEGWVKEGLSVEDALSRRFVARESPAYIVTAEFAVDFRQNHEYYKQRQPLNDRSKYRNIEMAFDGQVTMHVIRDDPDRVGSGTVAKGRIEELDPAKVGRPRPTDVWYWQVATGGGDGWTGNLADAFRGAVAHRIAEESYNGIACVCVSLIRKELWTSVQHDGETAQGVRKVAWRYWLSREHNLLPVRIDKLDSSREYVDPDGDVVVTDEDFNGEVVVSFIQSGFREIKPGVWVPMMSRSFRFWPSFWGEPPAVSETRIDTVLINDGVSVPARIVFPVGTVVSDEVAGTRYRVKVTQ